MQALVRIVGVLMMLTALAVSLTYAPDRSVESLIARWALPPSDFMVVRGQLVHFRDQGPRDDPEPLVLIHGAAASLHTWQGWVAALRARKRVITFDLPGFGLTGPFTADGARDDYRGDALAGFTLDFLDALRVKRFAIGGNSLGGEVAWRVAARAPDRAARLILVDSTGYDPGPADLPAAFKIARIPVFNHVAEYLTPRALVEDGVKKAYGDPSRATDELVDRHFELLTREGNRRALNLELRQFLADRSPQRIKTVHVPTLILWGAKDRLVSPADARAFLRDIAGSRLVVFPALGHVPQEEDPRASVAPVRAFLGLDPAAPPPVPPAAAPAASEPA
ncbi:MAG: alpha/beta hydrolase [Burkholderiaceae bacterium]